MVSMRLPSYTQLHTRVVSLFVRYWASSFTREITSYIHKQLFYYCPLSIMFNISECCVKSGLVLIAFNNRFNQFVIELKGKSRNITTVLATKF